MIHRPHVTLSLGERAVVSAGTPGVTPLLQLSGVRSLRTHTDCPVNPRLSSGYICHRLELSAPFASAPATRLCEATRTLASRLPHALLTPTSILLPLCRCLFPAA